VIGGRGGIRDLGEGLLDGTESELSLFGKSVFVFDGGRALNAELELGLVDVHSDTLPDTTSYVLEAAADYYFIPRWGIGAILGFASVDTGDVTEDDLTFGARTRYFFNRLAGGVDAAIAYTPGDEDFEEDVIAASAGLFWRW
jgi:hypothetical protein